MYVFTKIDKQPRTLHSDELTLTKHSQLSLEIIREAEEKLKRLGVEYIRVDGFLTQADKVMLKSFQKENKLAPTGEIDQATLNFLNNQKVNLYSE